MRFLPEIVGPSIAATAALDHMGRGEIKEGRIAAPQTQLRYSGKSRGEKRRPEDGMVFRILALLAALAIGATQAAAADKLVVAVNKLSAGSPLYIARAKGFFAEQNLDVSLLQANSAPTVRLAGDL